MAFTRRKVLQSGALAAALPARAQAYPSKPVKLIVPYPPGGPYDAIPRIVAQYAAEKHGWQVVVENRAGASGLVGVMAAKASPPDGYTLVVTSSSTHGSAPALKSNLPYDPHKDLAPVTLFADAFLVALVRQELPAKTIAELVALIRAKPGTLNYASGGYASQHHLATAMMLQRSGLAQDAAKHVPFQGLAPALNALVAGHVEFMITSTGAATQFIEKGELRALAITAAQRSPRFPDVPTMAEQGFPGYQVFAWCGLAAPAGTPDAVIARWNAMANEAMADPGVARKIANQDYEPRGGTTAAYVEYFSKDIEQYRRLVEATGLRDD